MSAYDATIYSPRSGFDIPRQQRCEAFGAIGARQPAEDSRAARRITIAKNPFLKRSL